MTAHTSTTTPAPGPDSHTTLRDATTADSSSGVRSTSGESEVAGTDATFGPPAESAGRIVLSASGRGEAAIWYTARDASGSWAPAEASTVVLRPNPASLAVPDAGDRPVLVSGGSGGLREYRWNPQRATFDVTGLVVATSPFHTSSAEAGAEAINVSVQASRFTQDSGSWLSSGEQKLGQLTAGGLSTGVWGPAAMAGSVAERSAADDASGTSVVVTVNRADSTSTYAFPGAAWFKRGGGGWLRATGYDGGALRSVTAVKHVETGWFIAAQEAPDLSPDTPRPETIWMSEDGTSWRPAVSGLIAEGAHSATVDDLCSDGKRTVAVGYTLTSAGVSTATWWYSDGGAWALGAVGAVGGQFQSCEFAGGTVRVTGYADGRTATWTSTDLRTFASEEVLDRWLQRTDPVRAGGGWVAGGGVDTAEFSGPVLWTSQDGKQWSWTRVPVGTECGPSTVQAVGDLVGILVDTPDGVRMWRVSMGATATPR